MTRTKTMILFYYIIIFMLFLILVLISLSLGPYGLTSPREILGCVFNDCNPRLQAILEYRSLRTIAGILVGAGLAVSGLTIQYVLKNPLADPYLLGVSSGAALGVIAGYYVMSNPKPSLLYFLALLAGSIAFIVVLGIGYGIGGSPTSLIVTGVSVSYALSGITIILMIKLADRLPYTFVWLFGTVAYPLKNYLTISATLTIISIIFLLLISNRIYALILGEDVSASLGVPVKRTRFYALALSAVIASSLVAIAGPVGFIGLAAPWLSRLIVGSRYPLAFSLSILLGAVLALASDIIARGLLAPSEIPLTAVTALFGGPLLFYLTKKTGW